MKIKQLPLILLICLSTVALKANEPPLSEILESIENKKFPINYYMFLTKGTSGDMHPFLVNKLYDGKFSIWRFTSRRSWQPIHNGNAIEFHKSAYNTFRSIKVSLDKRYISIGGIDESADESIRDYVKLIANKKFKVSYYFFYQKPYFIALKPSLQNNLSFFNFTAGRKWQPLHNAKSPDGYLPVGDTIDLYDFAIEKGDLLIGATMARPLPNRYDFRQAIEAEIIDNSTDQKDSNIKNKVRATDTDSDTDTPMKNEFDQSSLAIISGQKPVIVANEIQYRGLLNTNVRDCTIQTQPALKKDDDDKDNDDDKEMTQSNIKLWDIQGRLIKNFTASHQHKISHIAIPNNHKRIVSSSYDCTLKVWHIQRDNLSQGRLIKKIALNQPIKSFVPFHESDKVALSTPDEILVKDLITGETIKTLSSKRTQDVISIDITKADTRVVALDIKGNIRVWSWRKAEVLKILENTNGVDMNKIEITNDDDKVVSVGKDGFIRVWKLSSGRLFQKLFAHKGNISSLALSQDSQYIFSGGEDGFIKIWHIESGKLVEKIENKAPINAMRLSDDDRYIVTLNKGVIKVWGL